MIQNGLFPPEKSWTPPKLSELPSWKGVKRVALDLETKDPDLKELGPGSLRNDSHIVGFAMRIDDRSWYVPIAHAGGGNVDKDAAIDYFRDQAKVFDGDIVGANLQYEKEWLDSYHIRFKPRRWRDVIIASSIDYELHDRYDLDSICAREGVSGKDQGTLEAAAESFSVHPKKELWKLHSAYVANYAIADVDAAWNALPLIESRIEAKGCSEIYDIELRLLPVLSKMKQNGVRFSHHKLELVDSWAMQQEIEALNEVSRLTGAGALTIYDTTNAGAIARHLAAIGLTVPTTPKTGKPSIRKEWLAAQTGSPVTALLIRARKMNKLRTTFVESIRRNSIGDRIHPGYNQVFSNKEYEDGDDDGEGARFGRLSCKKPNIQQQPARDPEIGPMWRSIYLPEPGETWASLDYSQQEPRWVTHFAEAIHAPGAREAADRYRNDPNTDNHSLMQEILSWPGKQGRTRAKEIFLGKTYGMGEAKLCHKTGLPTVMLFDERYGVMRERAGPEGMHIITEFDRLVPYVSALAQRCKIAVRDHGGYIKTVLGRHCHFLLVKNPKTGKWEYDEIHKAISRLIQGSSGDQMKKAMVDVDDAGLPILIQVHDEIDRSVGNPKDNDIVRDIMLSAVKCNVPHKVDVETGPNWGEIK